MSDAGQSADIPKSDDVSRQQAVASSPLPSVEPDDSEPSPERQAELRAAYERNMAAGRPPYSAVEIHTRGELGWLLRERGWNGEPGRQAEFIDLREADLSGVVAPGASLSLANLSRAVLVEANLSSADLNLANLRGALLPEANLSGAKLGLADLSGAMLGGADLSGADLGLANLSGAMLLGANLSSAVLEGARLHAAVLHRANLHQANLRAASLVGADLSFSDVSGANMVVADLSGVLLGSNLSDVDLTSARMDAATLLGTFSTPVVIGSRVRLLDVSWNGANLASVQWDQTPRIGEEEVLKKAKTRRERIGYLQGTARAYRGLATALQAQGLTEPALRYGTRQYQLERKALFWQFKLGPWLFSWLLNIVSGYGDRPGRALACYLGVVAAFTGTYWAITNQVFGFIQSGSAHLLWYEALVLSISSFHGRGFFPSMLSLGDPIALVAAAEAIIGLFIELVFIATFTQRFFAR